MENLPEKTRLENYKKTVTGNFWMHTRQPASRFFHGLRMEMEQGMGQGWSEILCIHKGLYVEMAEGRLKHRLETCYRNTGNIPFQLHIILAGHVGVQIPGTAKQTFTAGDIWLVHGAFEEALCTQLPGENICGFSIGLPRNLLESWLGTSCGNAGRSLEKLTLGRLGRDLPWPQVLPLARRLRQSSECIRTARELVYARRQTLPDNLRFESLALELLSRILTLEDSAAGSCLERIGKVRAAVDKAVDILRHEWNDPPNISTLARRIGVNETYLKEWFRQQMGMPIGEYIRQQRMKKALELIETGRYSILNTALFVGYSNPSHFSAAFKKFYGNLPSYYLPKGGKTS